MLLGTHLILNRSEKAECFNIFPFAPLGPNTSFGMMKKLFEEKSAGHFVVQKISGKK